MFQDKNGGETNKIKGNISKKSGQGQASWRDKGGKMHKKGEDVATKWGLKKIKRKPREEREKVRNEIFIFLYKSQHHEKRVGLFGL